jgi:hypothetical protein
MGNQLLFQLIVVALSIVPTQETRGAWSLDIFTSLITFDSGRQFDEYGLLSVLRENVRLDNLAAQLKKEPNSKGYVVVYEGASDKKKEDLKSKACRAVEYLVLTRGVKPKQVIGITISGGHRENFTLEL